MDTQTLLDLIARRSAPEYIGEMQEGILQMVCNESQPMPLSMQDIYDAMARKGEFLLLTLDYDDIARELAEHKLRRKISEALSILVAFEDDGKRLKTIEPFIKYLHDELDDKQNFRFGIRRVAELSEYPVKILFSGILPINQLKLTIGTDIARLIEEDGDYLRPRFKAMRDDLSEKIGLPILPVRPETSEAIPPNRVRLVDPADGATLCQFDVERVDRAGLESYLTKLYYVYKALGEEWLARHKERTPA
ncbi:hypothetical protein [Hydrogenimonas sp.]